MGEHGSVWILIQHLGYEDTNIEGVYNAKWKAQRVRELKEKKAQQDELYALEKWEIL